MGIEARRRPGRPQWGIKWLVEREEQRKTATLLGVNGKTVALALRWKQSTGRMSLATLQFMTNLDDPEWEGTPAQDRKKVRILVVFEVAHGPGDDGGNSNTACGGLEAARESEDDTMGQKSAEAPDSEGQGLFNWRQRGQPKDE